jgi:DNA-binding response OmpR family regulator
MVVDCGKVLMAGGSTGEWNCLPEELRKDGFSVSLARQGKDAIRLLDTRPDALLVNSQLPDMRGIEVCRVVRGCSDIPLILLTSESDEIDSVLSFQLGVDDYVVEPFRVKELIARLRRAIQRREHYRLSLLREQKEDEVHQVGPLVVDPRDRKVEVGGRTVRVSRREVQLLSHLAASAGRPCSRKELLLAVWGKDASSESVNEHVIDTLINRLRAKIDRSYEGESLIRTIRGIGFMIEDVPSASRIPRSAELSG